MRKQDLHTDASGQSHFRGIDGERIEEWRGSKLNVG
jgi:hypothetical protein